MITINQIDKLTTWREHARALLMRGVEPKNIAWEGTPQNALLFDEQSHDYHQLPIIHNTLSIPKAFFSLAESVACFRDNRRWSLLYSIAWRLLFEDKRLLGMTIDSQVSQLLAMQKAVARDRHKMAAFVRFKCINGIDNDGEKNSHYVAWFEPEHLIVRSKAPFFRKRFSNMHWSILTPDLCAHWNTQQLTFSEGMAKPPNIDDDLETLWLTYYQHIFNPARLKIQAMQSEMPKKYWRNLPEAPIIQSLISGSSQQTDTMIQKACAPNDNGISQSAFVKQQQQALRQKREQSQEKKL